MWGIVGCVVVVEIDTGANFTDDVVSYVDVFCIDVVVDEVVVVICVGIAGMTSVDGVLSCCDDAFLSLMLMSRMVLIWASSGVCFMMYLCVTVYGWVGC